jgi:carbon monoxide dehydrogenase subunit G
MDMQGSRHLAVTQQQAWDALNDPEVLKTCIPGCDKVEATGENQYAISMAVKIGPVGARFNGKILLSDIVAPESYKINFEGQGGPAGFGKGSAAVNLAPAADGCDLTYTAQAQVGGKIAQVGQRLVDGVARSMAEDFFKRFDNEMQRRYPAAVAEPEVPTSASGTATDIPGGGAIPPAAAAPAEPTTGTRMPMWAWVVFGLAVLIAVVLLAR